MTGTAAHRWRILRTGICDAYLNMALDEVLFRSFIAGNASPLFRVYEWKRPAITAGYGQRVTDMFDLDACAVDGIEVTRRLTGGRAVFHFHEISYTVIGRTDDPVFGGSIRNTYRAINTVIAEAYRSLGIDAGEAGSRTLTDIPAGMRHVAPCFALPTPFELTAGGMKLTGGAQRRIGGTFLQQGTVRLGSGAERITGYLADSRAAMVYRQMLEPDTHLWDRDLPAPAMTDALVRVFGDSVGGTVDTSALSDDECNEAEHLSHTRYRAKGWIDGTGCESDL